MVILPGEAEHSEVNQGTADGGHRAGCEINFVSQINWMEAVLYREAVAD